MTGWGKLSNQLPSAAMPIALPQTVPAWPMSVEIELRAVIALISATVLFRIFSSAVSSAWASSAGSSTSPVAPRPTLLKAFSVRVTLSGISMPHSSVAPPSSCTPSATCAPSA